MYCDKARNAAALDEFVAHQVARPLGSSHEDIHVGGGDDLAVVDVETVGEHEISAFFEVRCDFGAIDGALQLIGKQDDNNVSLGSGSAGIENLETCCFGLGFVVAPGKFADNHFDSAVLQVVGMSVPLAPVTDDRHLLPLQDGGIAVLVIINLHVFLLFCLSFL